MSRIGQKETPSSRGGTSGLLQASSELALPVHQPGSANLNGALIRKTLADSRTSGARLASFSEPSAPLAEGEECRGRPGLFANCESCQRRVRTLRAGSGACGAGLLTEPASREAFANGDALPCKRASRRVARPSGTTTRPGCLAPGTGVGCAPSCATDRRCLKRGAASGPAPRGSAGRERQKSPHMGAG